MNHKQKCMFLSNRYDTTTKLLRARLVGMGYSYNDIDDIIQEAFISAYINMAKLRNNDRFDFWITKIAKNIGNKNFKRDEKKIYFVDNIEFENKMYETYGYDETLHDKIMLAIEIRKLPLNLREAFCLNALSGFTYLEIARILRVAPWTAQKRISRAKAELRKRLGTDQPDIDKTLVDKSALPISVILLLLSQLFDKNM